MKLLSKTTSLSSLLLALTVAFSVEFAPAASQPAVSIDSITYGGSGCPQDSLSNFLSDDKTKFTLTYTSFKASISPGSVPTEARRSCQINAIFKYSPGWQFSLSTVQYKGSVELQQGVSGMHSGLYYFQGSTEQSSTSKNFQGPLALQSYAEESSFANKVWSDCTGTTNLNIKTNVAVTGANGLSGHMSNDIITFASTQSYGVTWRECPK
ncbi:hypothetical protein HDU92_008988 [Lobulomyces angularis]|nr:hypothetical protein HDU92_008988 [Lobulomyces angularis]